MSQMEKLIAHLSPHHHPNSSSSLNKHLSPSLDWQPKASVNGPHLPSLFLPPPSWVVHNPQHPHPSTYPTHTQHLLLLVGWCDALRSSLSSHLCGNSNGFICIPISQSALTSPQQAIHSVGSQLPTGTELRTTNASLTGEAAPELWACTSLNEDSWLN